MTRPPGGVPGHPEPEPVPTPEPDPPMPIPPPDPVPPPEPPHRAPAAGPDDTFIDAPPAPDPQWPPPGAFPDETPATEPIHPGDQPITEPVAVWRQPPPAEPWHARHEKPGEWRTTPPEHLAYPHALPEQPTAVVPYPEPAPADRDDRRRKTGLWLSVALTTTLLLCGGGTFSAYLLLRDADGSGAPDPATAVNEFLTAVYTRQDAAEATELVCREARDADRLAARVREVKGLANEYDGPAFRWNEPAVSTRTEERATVSVQLTMSTDDEKTAEQTLTFTTVRKTGWLVCEISG